MADMERGGMGLLWFFLAVLVAIQIGKALVLNVPGAGKVF